MTPQNKKQQMLHNSSRILLYSSILQKTAIANRQGVAFWYLRQSGFIALVSVILISFVLITFTVSIGLSGFLGRSNQLESEFKEQSIASAEACVEKAIADLVAANPTEGTVTFGGGAYSCTIMDIVPNPPDPLILETTIKSQGIYPITPPLTRSSYTNLVVVVNSADQRVISWREYAVMP